MVEEEHVEIFASTGYFESILLHIPVMLGLNLFLFDFRRSTIAIVLWRLVL